MPELNDPFQPRPVWLRYSLAVAAVVLTLLVKLGLGRWIDPQSDTSATFAIFFSAVAISAWFGGFGPGLFATLLALVLSNYFFIPPFNTFGFTRTSEFVNSLLFLIEGIIVSLLCMQLRVALRQARRELRSRQQLEARLREEGERFAVTLSSIGDGVIATDAGGRVSFMNQIAANLSAWSSAEAEGHRLEEVFRIINEETRQPVVSPVTTVLQTGTIVGLANHTLLLARNGREIPIDDSGAPIRLASGEVIGVVLVFRDVTERRQAETERNRLFANEQSARREAELARDRLGRLQAATVEFSRALTTSQVAQVVLEQATATLGAEAGVIALFDAAGSDLDPSTAPQLQIVHTIGYSQEEAEQWQRFSLDSRIPLTEAIRSGQANWFSSLEETLAHFPEMAAVKPRGEARINVPLKGENGAVAGALSIRFNHPHHFEELELSFILTLVEQAAQALERARLYEVEQRARREAEVNQKRLLFLAEASRALASSLDYELTLQNIARLAVPTFADWGVVDLVMPDKSLQRVVAIHQDPAKQALLLEMEARYPTDPDAPYGFPKVIRSGQAELLPYITEPMLQASAKDARQLEMLRELGLQSNICVPLIRRGETLGALSFATAESGRHYDEADLSLAEELGQRAALALDNARLYRQTQLALEEREAALKLHRQREEQLGLLVEAAHSLVSSLDLNTLLKTILDLSTRLIEADAYAMWGYEPARNLWRPLISAGLSPAFRQTNLQEYESNRVFNQPIIAPVVEEVPALANRLESYREEGICSMLVIPLSILDKSSGSLVFYYRQRHSFSPLETSVANALANLAAAALGNAALYEEQTSLRREAELARERLAYLSEASTVLATSLDYETTLQNVVELAVPRLADWCAIDLPDENGQLIQVALAPRDPEKIALAHRLRERYPPTPEAPGSVLTVFNTGQSQMVNAVTDEMLQAGARDAEHLELMRRLGLKSIIVTPLTTRGRILGVLTLASTQAERSFGAADLFMAEELARRASQALDKALLYKQAQDAVRARDEFLSVAAHELKTPITSQRGFTQMLLRQLEKDPAPQRLQRILETINQQSLKLERLVSQLLDISRLEGAKLTLQREEVDLDALVTQVITTLQSRTDRHTISLQAVSPLPVWLDPLRIEQVVINLLDNAIKYSPDGGRIEVVVTTPTAETVKLSVTDQGIGVAPEHRDHLFDRFYQAHAENFYGGMGLGLYISRQIVELHGGQLYAEFPPEGGTCFIMVLPRGLVEEAIRQKES